MTTRPLFLPHLPGQAEHPGVKQMDIAFQWVPGLAKTQQAKCLSSLQAAIRQSGAAKNPLEVSTRSNDPIGQALSAYRLELPDRATVELHYQAAKIYPYEGPHPEWFKLSPEALRSEVKAFKARIQKTPLQGFQDGINESPWQLTPPHAFYDWLYLSALRHNPAYAKHLLRHDGFTDLAFNPTRSFNSQAYAAALYASFHAFGCLEEALASRENFLKLHPNDPLFHPKSNRQPTSMPQQSFFNF